MLFNFALYGDTGTEVIEYIDIDHVLLGKHCYFKYSVNQFHFEIQFG